MLSLDMSRAATSSGADCTTTMGAGGGTRYFQNGACAAMVAWMEATALQRSAQLRAGSPHLGMGGVLVNVPKSSSGTRSPSSTPTQAAMDALMDVRLYPPCPAECRYAWRLTTSSATMTLPPASAVSMWVRMPYPRGVMLHPPCAAW